MLYICIICNYNLIWGSIFVAARHALALALPHLQKAL
jgi:hypothetical protein